tara:strand:- start:10 stop:507 length:498 start_codon:yes stop_codon:yes gene_type:complete
MTVMSATIGFAFLSNILIFYFLWRSNKLKNTQARLRVSKGRRFILSLSIRNAEKKLATNQNLSLDISNKRKDLEISHNLLTMRDQNLSSLVELTRLMDLKLELLEKSITGLRIPQTSVTARKKPLTKDKKVEKNASVQKVSTQKRQREDIENELFDKINKLNKNR